MSPHNDNAPCPRCSSVIADAKGEPVMATHWRVWIVCRACAAQINNWSIGELANTPGAPTAQRNA